MNLKHIISIAFLLIAILSCSAQDNLNSTNTKGNTFGSRLILMLDTIFIPDPIIIKLNKDGYDQLILISKSDLDSSRFKTNPPFKDFILRKGYLFYVPYIFVDFLTWQLKLDPFDLTSQKLLKDMIAFNKKETQSISEKTMQYKGWSYNQANSQKFICFLINGATLQEMTGEESIRLDDMSNIYFKVLVPLQW